MKKFTNHTPGLRGIRTKDGLVWIEPGKSASVDPEAIVGPLPDLGKPGAASAEEAADRDSEVERLKADHAATLDVQIARADDAEKALAETRAEVERLKAEAAFATPVEIKMAVALLDKADDTHWTGAGLPAVDAVKSLVGKDVSRDQIAAVAPEAKRPT